MVQRDLVSRKIARATSWIDDAQSYFARPRDAFLADAKGRDLAAFYLFLAIQECIDLAAHWTSDSGLGPPEEAASTFDVLADKALITREVATGMRGAVGLRNRIAHGYSMLDHGRLYEEAGSGIPTLRRFLLAVATAAGL